MEWRRNKVLIASFRFGVVSADILRIPVFSLARLPSSPFSLSNCTAAAAFSPLLFASTYAAAPPPPDLRLPARLALLARRRLLSSPRPPLQQPQPRHRWIYASPPTLSSPPPNPHRSRSPLSSRSPRRPPPPPPSCFATYSGKSLVETARSIFRKDKKLQENVLFCSQMLYLLLAIISSRFYFGFHGSSMNRPLDLQICTIYTEGVLLLSIVVVAVQIAAHVITRHPLLPEAPRNRIIVLLFQTILMLAVQLGSCATSSLQSLLSDGHLATSDYDKQLFLFSWFCAAASTIYSLIVYLTTIICEKQFDLEDGPGQAAEVDYSSFESLLPRVAQCIFGFLGSMTMQHALTYDIYPFRYLVYSDFGLICWNILISILLIYYKCSRSTLPSWVNTSIWLGDLVMLSVLFRAFSAAASIVVLMSVDINQCNVLQCNIFGMSTILTSLAYISLLIPTVTVSIKRVHGG